MSDTTSKTPAPARNRLISLLYRPPWVGLLAFLVVFLVQGLGHTQMILMEAVFGEGFIYQSAFLTGLVGAIALVIGMRSQSEVAATWWGFLAGSELWTGWVEPGKYWLELTMFFAALVITAVIAVLTPAHYKAQLQGKSALQKS